MFLTKFIAFFSTIDLSGSLFPDQRKQIEKNFYEKKAIIFSQYGIASIVRVISGRLFLVARYSICSIQSARFLPEVELESGLFRHVPASVIIPSRPRSILRSLSVQPDVVHFAGSGRARRTSPRNGCFPSLQFYATNARQ